jgi:hypothetical protein
MRKVPFRWAFEIFELGEIEKAAESMEPGLSRSRMDTEEPARITSRRDHRK